MTATATKIGRQEMVPPDAHRQPTVCRTYRFRLYPTKAQVAALEEQLGACCDLYNAALEQRKRAWREHGRTATLYGQMRELTEVRKTDLVPAGMSCTAQRSALERLDRAMKAFFRRVKAGERPGYPRFQSRWRYDSLTWVAGLGARFDTGRVRLQGIGSVRVRQHRLLPDGAEQREITVRRLNGRWYVCIGLALRPSDASRSVAEVGVDLGVTNLIALSTGEVVCGPSAERGNAKRRRRAERAVARRKRGSLRRRKAVALLGRQRERECNRRRDHAHKLSRRLVDAYGLIAVEDLAVSRMVRSGNRSKAGLNRSIQDQGWSALIEMLVYKAEGAGGRVVKVDPRYTSQTCAECGHIARENRRGEAFRCLLCGHEAHADVNAARNILARARPGRGRQALTRSEEACVA